MNILFFLTPKASCTYVYDDFTIRQAMEKLESRDHTTVPILSRAGVYRGTLTEGDLLWALKDRCHFDMKAAEEIRIMDIPHRQDNAPVLATTDIRDLIASTAQQNFVPVVDDKGDFIGIIGRNTIIEHFQERLAQD